MAGVEVGPSPGWGRQDVNGRRGVKRSIEASAAIVGIYGVRLSILHRDRDTKGRILHARRPGIGLRSCCSHCRNVQYGGSDFFACQDLEKMAQFFGIVCALLFSDENWERKERSHQWAAVNLAGLDLCLNTVILDQSVFSRL